VEHVAVQPAVIQFPNVVRLDNRQGGTKGRRSMVAPAAPLPLQFFADADDKVTEAGAPAQWRGLALGTYRHGSLPGGRFCTLEVRRSLPACFTAVTG
jgi:hypothetical protein